MKQKPPAAIFFDENMDRLLDDAIVIDAYDGIKVYAMQTPYGELRVEMGPDGAEFTFWMDD